MTSRHDLWISKEIPALDIARWSSLSPASLFLLLFLAPAGCQNVNYSGTGAGRATAATESSRETSPPPRPLPVVRPRASIPEEVLNANGLETIWTQQVLDGVFRQVHVSGDDIYAVEERSGSRRTQHLIDFKRSDGLRRWVWELKAPLKHAPSVYHYPAATTVDARDDEVYVVQKDEVYCLDYRFGNTLWKAALGFSISSGAVASETHYFVGSYNGRIYGILKKKEIDDWFYISAGDVRSPGAVRDVYAYFTSSDGKAYKFHGAAGRRHDRSWMFPAGGTKIPHLRGAPVVFSRFVFLGSTDYKLYCLLDLDGALLWDFQAQAPIQETPVAVAFRPNLDIVFCITDDRRRNYDKKTLWAIDARRGNSLWKREHVEKVVATGKDTVYLLTDPRSGRGRSLLGVEGDSGEEKFAISVDGFEFVPASVGVPPPQQNQRAIIYLVHKSGFIQAIGEQL